MNYGTVSWVSEWWMYVLNNLVPLFYPKFPCVDPDPQSSWIRIQIRIPKAPEYGSRSGSTKLLHTDPDPDPHHRLRPIEFQVLTKYRSDLEGWNARTVHSVASPHNIFTWLNCRLWAGDMFHVVDLFRKKYIAGAQLKITLSNLCNEDTFLS